MLIFAQWGVILCLLGSLLSNAGNSLKFYSSAWIEGVFFLSLSAGVDVCFWPYFETGFD